MRSSALLERFRMALGVIANGPEWEPGTVTARLALMPPEVAMRNPYEGMSVREAVEQAEKEPEAEPIEKPEPWKVTTTITPVIEPDPDPVAEDDGEADEKPGRVREKVGEDGLTDTQRAILEFIRARGQVNVPMIQAAVDGATTDKLKRGLKLLRNRGLIAGWGATAARTYTPVDPKDKPAPVSTPAPPKVEDSGRTDGYTLSGMPAVQAEAARNGPGSDEGRVLEAVKYRPRWTIEQHAQRLDLPVDRVAVAMRKLEEEFEVQSMASGGRVAWVIR